MPSLAAAVPQGIARSVTGMDEDNFRLFYARTARPLRNYLLHALSDRSLTDDLLQESYLRLLAANLPLDMEDEHRKNYLFRIASNLLHHPSLRTRTVPLVEYPQSASLHDHVAERHDMQQVLEKLKPRQRELLWLAYVERFSHAEIASIVGARVQSIRPMLARARDTLATLLRGRQERAHTEELNPSRKER